MKMFFWTMFMLFFSQAFCSEILHRSLQGEEKKASEFIWEERQIAPFDELLVSWDAERPSSGSFSLQVSLWIDTWSPWLDYAFWGPEDQYTFKQDLLEFGVRVYQDAVEVLEQGKATGFRIRVLANDQASLTGFRALHISAIDRSRHSVNFTPVQDLFIELPVAGLSQMALPDERNHRLCSPTSTTAVINFLSDNLNVSPLDFANSIVDSAFDIYGNWILNTAQASHWLGKSWHCFVARLTSFNQIIEQLIKGYPVVVSVKGPLPGGALPYASGHLVVVTGYDSKNQEVICMDPAFPSNDLTHIRYPLNEFLNAWKMRQGIAYLFHHSLSLNEEL